MYTSNESPDCGVNIDENGIANLGLVIHGLQYAERHKGAIYLSGEGNHHNIVGDMIGGPLSSHEVTSTVALVYGILQGDFSKVGNGSYLYTLGMNTSQIAEIMMGSFNNGYNASYDSNNKKLTLIIR